MNTWQLYPRNIADSAISHDLPRLSRQAAILETVLFMLAMSVVGNPVYKARVLRLRRKAMIRVHRRLDKEI